MPSAAEARNLAGWASAYPGTVIVVTNEVGMGIVPMHPVSRDYRDRLGRAYEYFISQFAGAEGRRGGEFFTPPSLVRMIVNVIEPDHGLVLDPCGDDAVLSRLRR